MKGSRWLAPLLVLALGAILRWFPGATLSLGVDEGVSILNAAPPIGDIFARMQATHEVHPPLYFYYLHPWIAGLSPGAFVHGGGEAWFRLGNLPWALLTVGFTMALGHRLGGRRVALGAGLLAATSSYLLFYALEVRMYAMLAAFVLGMAWAASARRWWGAAIFGLLAFFTQYEAVFFIAALGLFCMLEERPTWRRWLGPALGLAAGLVLWVPVVMAQAGQQSFSLRDTPSWPQAVELLFEMVWGVTWPLPLPGWRTDDGALPTWKWAGLVAALLVGGGVWRAKSRSRRFLACFIGLPLVAVFGVSIVTSLRVFEYKYMQPMAPFACIALAMWLASVTEETPSPPRVGLVVVGAGILVNLAAWVGFARDAAWYGPQDWRGVVARVAPRLGPTDVVVVHPSMMAAPVLVYAWLGEPRLFTPTGASRVVPVDDSDAPALREALSTASGAFLLTTLAHPWVGQQRLLERLPRPWVVDLVGETSSYWPANRIQIFRLSRSER